MARTIDKNKAMELRKKGMSYSQIKNELGISKSTLSNWLYKMPLSEKRIRELNSQNPIRIERYRNTMKNKRDARLLEVYKKVSKEIGRLSKRELLLAGLFLYWGEGGKVSKYMTTFSNTDPKMIKFFLNWITRCFGIDRDKITVLLHLYSDMNIEKYKNFWSKELNLKIEQFKKPYIKNSTLANISYKNGFGKGTCNIRIYSRDINEYIMQSIKYLGNIK